MRSDHTDRLLNRFENRGRREDYERLLDQVLASVDRPCADQNLTDTYFVIARLREHFGPGKD